jgi:ABC-type transport system substrate-binding protein
MSPRRLRTRAFLVLAVLASACSPQVPPEPTLSIAPSASASSQVAEKLVVGVHIPPARVLGDFVGMIPTDLPLYSLDPNGSNWDDVVRRFVYSGIYRYDDKQSPVPDLANGACAVSRDLLVITCGLVEAMFHDGTPVTAADVAFTYELLLSTACRQLNCYVPDEARLKTDKTPLATVQALDQRTVIFTLRKPDPVFMTIVLAEALIEPRARVMTAYDEFVQASKGADPRKLATIAESLDVAMHPPGSDSCHAPDDVALKEAERAISGIGRELRSRNLYAPPVGSCAYGDYLVRVLNDAADALELRGIDAIAAAYRILKRPTRPIGSGPWRVLAIEPGERMQLVAFDGFQRKAPATRLLEVRILHTPDEAIKAVRSGDIHWLLQPFPSGTEPLVADGIGDAPGVAWETFSREVYYGLHYNVRDGLLFSDPKLREAMELCLDKEETVAAATGSDSGGVPIYSPITPSSWAYRTDLPRPSRDIARARKLIEDAGWKTGGADGIYTKAGRRLSSDVPVQDGTEHQKFVELLAFQVADCGIEIVPLPLSSEEFDATLSWPLKAPGASKQWDAVFTGNITWPDPDLSAVFRSNYVPSKTSPESLNLMGYDNKSVNELLDRARATYSQPERARIYKEFQLTLASERPILFAWSPSIREPRSDRLASTTGPLALSTRTWWWELETLLLRPPAQ